jgi:hypothetical protein
MIQDRNLAAGSFWLQDSEKAADLHMLFQRVSQVQPSLEPVMILAADALMFEVASLFEIDHDPLHRPFGNLHLGGNVSQANVGHDRNAVKDVGVIAQERPVVGI